MPNPRTIRIWNYPLSLNKTVLIIKGNYPPTQYNGKDSLLCLWGPPKSCLGIKYMTHFQQSPPCLNSIKPKRNGIGKPVNINCLGLNYQGKVVGRLHKREIKVDDGTKRRNIRRIFFMGKQL